MNPKNGSTDYYSMETLYMLWLLKVDTLYVFLVVQKQCQMSEEQPCKISLDKWSIFVFGFVRSRQTNNVDSESVAKEI